MTYDQFKKPSTSFSLNKESISKINSDPALFCKAYFGLPLHDYQKKIISDCLDCNKVAVRMCRQAGKSTTIAAFCLYWAFFVPNQTIIIVSDTYRAAEHLFQIMKGLVSNAPYISNHITENFVTRMRWDNGSEIKALPTGVDGHTIRGLTAHVLVLEESAFIDDRIVDEVLIPMTAATSGKIIQISTPIGRNHFFDAFKEDSSYAKHHYSWVDAVNAGQLTKEFIEERRKNSSSIAFAREFEALFTESENTAFPWQVVSPNIHREFSIPQHFDAISSSGDYFIGYDIGRFGSKAVISVISRKDDDKLKLVYYKEMSKVSFDEQFVWLTRLCKHFNPKKVLIDATGQGLPIAERFKNDKVTKFFPLKAIIFGTKSKMAMASYFRKVLEHREIVLPNDKRLLDQILNQEHRLSKDGHDLYNCPDGENDDILWATLLAAFGTRRAYSDDISYCIVR
ncbi:MAG TPA: hypothetical protein ENH95_06785 [Nitrosopumilus sp.]|nr:hypothetical protein [Nitrosopumilus sp.]